MFMFVCGFVILLPVFKVIKKIIKVTRYVVAFSLLYNNTKITLTLSTSSSEILKKKIVPLILTITKIHRRLRLFIYLYLKNNTERNK